MKKARIGISASTMVADGNLERSYVNQDYIISLEKAGAVPVIIPVVQDVSLVEEQLEFLDGVVISGGADIDPWFYHEEVKNTCGFTNHALDAFTLATIRAAYEAELPLFGICRGCQAINVAFGGTLYQDIPTDRPGSYAHLQKAERWEAIHDIAVDEESFLYSLMGNRARVNSFHHQAVARVADGFIVTARARDGIVECLEKEAGGFVCGVQFHPEMMAAHGDPLMLEVFQKFVRICTND